MQGWNAEAQRDFPGSFESVNLGRDNLSNLVGRLGVAAQQTGFGQYDWMFECQILDCMKLLLRT